MGIRRERRGGAHSRRRERGGEKGPSGLCGRMVVQISVGVGGHKKDGIDADRKRRRKDRLSGAFAAVGKCAAPTPFLQLSYKSPRFPPSPPRLIASGQMYHIACRTSIYVAHPSLRPPPFLPARPQCVPVSKQKERSVGRGEERKHKAFTSKRRKIRMRKKGALYRRILSNFVRSEVTPIMIYATDVTTIAVLTSQQSFFLQLSLSKCTT